MLEELSTWFKEGLNFLEETVLPLATLALEFVPGVPPSSRRLFPECRN